MVVETLESFPESWLHLPSVTSAEFGCSLLFANRAMYLVQPESRGLACSGQTAPASPNWAAGGGVQLVDEKGSPGTWFPPLKFLGFEIRQLLRTEELGFPGCGTEDHGKQVPAVLHMVIEFSVDFLKKFFPLF